MYAGRKERDGTCLSVNDALPFKVLYDQLSDPPSLAAVAIVGLIIKYFCLGGGMLSTLAKLCARSAAADNDDGDDGADDDAGGGGVSTGQAVQVAVAVAKAAPGLAGDGPPKSPSTKVQRQASLKKKAAPSKARARPQADSIAEAATPSVAAEQEDGYGGEDEEDEIEIASAPRQLARGPSGAAASMHDPSPGAPHPAYRQQSLPMHFFVPPRQALSERSRSVAVGASKLDGYEPRPGAAQPRLGRAQSLRPMAQSHGSGDFVIRAAAYNAGPEPPMTHEEAWERMRHPQEFAGYPLSPFDEGVDEGAFTLPEAYARPPTAPWMDPRDSLARAQSLRHAQRLSRAPSRARPPPSDEK